MTDVSGGEQQQFGAIPFAVAPDGGLLVFLVTSRGSGRWTIPKGNPIAGKKPHRAAAIEALEEGGLVGRVSKKPLGSYTFWKRRTDYFELATVTVFPLQVTGRKARWKESGLRRVEAFPVMRAAELVVESGLAELIGSLSHEPRLHRGKRLARQRRESLAN
jgi:8-oxo-dGTP pyrophosphatase MutT (NUDIX family)